jgi:hypothetical protein
VIEFQKSCVTLYERRLEASLFSNIIRDRRRREAVRKGEEVKGNDMERGQEPIND